MLHRRSFLFGLAAVAAPAIIRPGILMPVNKVLLPEIGDGVALLATSHPHNLYIYDGSGSGRWVAADQVERLSLANLNTKTVFGVVAASSGDFHLGDVVILREQAPSPS